MLPNKCIYAALKRASQHIKQMKLQVQKRQNYLTCKCRGLENQDSL